MNTVQHTPSHSKPAANAADSRRQDGGTPKKQVTERLWIEHFMELWDSVITETR